MLQAKGLHYARGGRPILAGVDLELEPGSLTVLAGPNGAGKSTLLGVLCGDLHPDAGQVLLDGSDLHSRSPRDLARRRAVMPQETRLDFAFTAEEVVWMGRHPLAGPRRDPEGAEVVRRAMAATDTEGLRERSFPSLSGGEKARVTFARVLTQQTPLLFLDEPTASLDPRHQHLLMRLAKEQTRQGSGVLAVLHDLNLAALYADTIVLMRGGKVQAAGTPECVLTPAILFGVFDTPFQVLPHPHLPRPLVLSLPED